VENEDKCVDPVDEEKKELLKLFDGRCVELDDDELEELLLLLIAKFRDEMSDDFKDELKDELRDELKNELKDDRRDGLGEEWPKELLLLMVRVGKAELDKLCVKKALLPKVGIGEADNVEVDKKVEMISFVDFEDWLLLIDDDDDGDTVWQPVTIVEVSKRSIKNRLY